MRIRSYRIAICLACSRSTIPPRGDQNKATMTAAADCRGCSSPKDGRENCSDTQDYGSSGNGHENLQMRTVTVVGISWGCSYSWLGVR